MAQTGKIAGTVIDAETGSPLPGVNVIIEGTTRGATTNAEGYYSIVNLEPGEYDVRATFVGYEDYLVQDVQVTIGLTSEVNIPLQQETVGLDEVVVTAEPPVIQADISGTQINVTAEEIQAARYQDVTDVLNFQVGVQSTQSWDDTPTIRGSGMTQMNFIVDGVSQRDPLTNRPNLSVNLEAVKQIKIQTGGFSAEYGNIRSGLVQVVTKEGTQEYSGSFDFQYSPPALKHFGPMMYSFGSPVVVPFVSREAGAFTGNRFFSGWNVIANERLQPGDPHYGKPMELYARYLWRHRSQDAVNELKRLEEQGVIEWGKYGVPEAFHQYGDRPDWNASATFGGPVPLLPQTTFFVSYAGEFIEYSNQFAQLDGYSDRQVRVKITTHPFEHLELNLTYFNAKKKGGEGGQGPGVGGDAFISRDPYDQLTATNKLWYPHCAVPGMQLRQYGSLNLTHTLSSNTFYELQLTHRQTGYEMLKDFRNTAPIPGTNGVTSSSQSAVEEGRIGTAERANRLAEAGEPGWEHWREWAMIKIGDYWYDEAPKGYGPVNWRDITGYYRMESCNLRQNDTYSRSWTLKGSIISQVNQHNQINAGFKVERIRINQYYEAIDPSVNAGSIWNSFATPWRGAFYLEDKLEFEGLVANLGLRLDWMVHGEFPVLDGGVDDKVDGPYSKFLLPEMTRNDQGEYALYEKIPTERVTQFRLSPRLGVSHPISTVAKIFFNYGHFYQWPNLFQTYQIEYNTRAAFRVDDYGNPMVKPPRTIAYELGYEHNLFNRMLLRVTGYYKDISAELGEVGYNFLAGGSYEIYTNKEYSDIRGLEAQLSLRRGAIPYFSGFASIDYMVESEGEYGVDDYFEDPTRQPELEGTEVSSPDVRPIFKMNLNFHTPEDFGPQWGVFSPLGSMSLSLMYVWQRGERFTWNPQDFPLVENNVRWRPYQRWDLRFRKTLVSYGDVESIFYIDVINLFNNHNMNYEMLGWMFDGHKWWNNTFREYMESLHMEVQPDGSIKGEDRPGDWKADYIKRAPFSPLEFLEKRDIFFGIKFRF